LFVRLVLQDSKVVVDGNSGRPYVWNAKTGNSRWLKRANSGGADDWEVFRDPRGKEYVASRSQMTPGLWIDALFHGKALEPMPPPPSDGETSDEDDDVAPAGGAVSPPQAGATTPKASAPATPSESLPPPPAGVATPQPESGPPAAGAVAAAEGAAPAALQSPPVVAAPASEPEPEPKAVSKAVSKQSSLVDVMSKVRKGSAAAKAKAAAP